MMSDRIGIEQQLVGIKTMAGVWLVWSVNPIPVDRARAHIGQITMPDLIGVFRQLDPLQFLLAVFVEKADFHLGGVGRKYGEVCALPIPGCTSGMRQAFSDRGAARFVIVIEA